VLFEGQIEDLNIVISDTTVGLKVSAFGLQNVLKEVSVRQFWSKRDMDWTQVVTQQGMVVAAGNLTPNTGAWTVNTGQFDPTDLSKQGVQVVGVQGGSAAVRDYGGGESRLPLV
ncbi:MAG: hypothetical protein KGL35_23290, partial [Bradyrhizobium sp.]|nr:hypothetical protein [Bradyrhizobium sp.]